jgi:hypothetical protein
MSHDPSRRCVGGGIFNQGTMSVNMSTVSHNTGQGGGGGIVNVALPNVLDHSTSG